MMETSDPTTIFYIALAGLGAAVLAILANVLRALGDALVKKISNEETAKRVELVRSEASIVVDMIEQTMRPKVAAALADGRLDAEERIALRDAGLLELKARFGVDFWERLFAALGIPGSDRDRWLLGMIEAFVFRSKPTATPE